MKKIFAAVFVVSMLSACGGGSDTTASSGTAGTLEFSSSNIYSINESNSDVSLNLIVSRAGGSDGAVSIDYSTSDNTAVASEDFSNNTGTLNWGDGDGADKNISLLISGDALAEFSETFSITLSGVVAASIGSDISNIVTIADDDSVTVEGTAYSTCTSETVLKTTTKVIAGIGLVLSPITNANAEVIRVDADGARLDTVVTAITDSNGKYRLVAPSGEVPASDYIVEVTDVCNSVDVKLASRITNTVDLTVDPSTNATSELISSNTTDLTQVTVKEVELIQAEVEKLLTEVDLTTDSDVLSQDLVTAAENNTTTNNIIESVSTLGQICGAVVKPDSGVGITPIPLEGIKVIAQEISDSVITRAITFTAADGSYCMNVMPASYVLGAINSTVDTDRSASEWYTTAGGADNRYTADVIAVADTTPITGIDFSLDPGVTVSGTVTTAVSATGYTVGQPLEGIKITVRNLDTNISTAATRTKADGSYLVNVKSGIYSLFARNRTVAPYASEVLDETGTSNVRNVSQPIDLTTVGASFVGDFALEQGYLLSGRFTEVPLGETIAAPIVGTLVATNADRRGPADRSRTDNNGEHRVWLKPDIYDIFSHGFRFPNADLTANNYIASFNSAGNVGTQPILVQYLGQPVPEAKVRVRDASTGGFYGFNVSNSDGSTSVYMGENNPIDVTIEARIDSKELYGSTYYNGANIFANATVITLQNGVNNTPITIDLAEAGYITGTVTTDGSTPAENIQATIFEGTISGNNLVTNQRTVGNGTFVVSVAGGTSGSPIQYVIRLRERDAAGVIIYQDTCDVVNVTAGGGNNISIRMDQAGSCVATVE